MAFDGLPELGDVTPNLARSRPDAMDRVTKRVGGCPCDQCPGPDRHSCLTKCGLSQATGVPIPASMKRVMVVRKAAQESSMTYDSSNLEPEIDTLSHVLSDGERLETHSATSALYQCGVASGHSRACVSDGPGRTKLRCGAA